MSKARNHLWTPRLRFPEFLDAGEWKEKRLDRVCEVNPKSEALPDEFVYIDLESVEAGNLLQKNIINRSEAPSRAQRLLEHGDIIFQLVRPYQKNNYLFNESDRTRYVASTGYAQLRAKQSNAYLYQFVHTESFVSKVLSLCEGSNYPAIASGELSKILVKVPGPDEQQKIASCLSSLDELIFAQSRKLEALQDYKKGLMQQLFPQQGETLPRSRFPGFRDAGEWDRRAMKDLYSFVPTNSFSREQLNYMEGHVRNIHYGDIHTQFSTHFDMKNEIVPFVNPSESLGKIRPESYCVEGDLIFADASEDLSDVGKCIEIVKLNDEKLISGLHTILARQKHESLVVGFGGYLFESDQVRAQIIKESHGTKVVGISAGRLSRMEICFPPQRIEQQKIASCLSSVVQLISEQSRRLDALRIHKKGLMQQLFPVSEESHQ